jgi:Flp pilus assembly protein TadD
MKQLHRSRWSGMCALLGVLCVVLSGCSSPGLSAAVGSGTRPGPVQGLSPNGQDPPPTAKTLYSMADILATQGKDTECEFVLRRCISQYPLFTPAYNSLAELQMRQGRVHEAAAVLTKATEIRPRDPVLLNNIGMCLLVRREYAKALSHFTEAAGIVPESEKFRANMATCLGLMGRHKESLALLQQVLPEEEARRNADILHNAWEKQTDPAGQSHS